MAELGLQPASNSRAYCPPTASCCLKKVGGEGYRAVGAYYFLYISQLLPAVKTSRRPVKCWLLTSGMEGRRETKSSSPCYKNGGFKHVEYQNFVGCAETVMINRYPIGKCIQIFKLLVQRLRATLRALRARLEVFTSLEV